MAKEIIELDSSFISTGNAVGRKESEGPLGDRFDICDSENRRKKANNRRKTIA